MLLFFVSIFFVNSLFTEGVKDYLGGAIATGINRLLGPGDTLPLPGNHYANPLSEDEDKPTPPRSPREKLLDAAQDKLAALTGDLGVPDGLNPFDDINVRNAIEDAADKAGRKLKKLAKKAAKKAKEQFSLSSDEDTDEEKPRKKGKKSSSSSSSSSDDDKPKKDKPEEAKGKPKDGKPKKVPGGIPSRNKSGEKIDPAKLPKDKNGNPYLPPDQNPCCDEEKENKPFKPLPDDSEDNDDDYSIDNKKFVNCKKYITDEGGKICCEEYGTIA